jgi:Asp-tRNA(Asn)/Glu-tRNA(Gln) amidotransferase A subunit family amidase
MPHAAEEEPIWLPAHDLVDAYRRRDLSPVEVVRRVLDRITDVNDELGAFVTVSSAEAIEQAAKRATLPPAG